jgi:hypothetical protein
MGSRKRMGGRVERQPRGQEELERAPNSTTSVAVGAKVVGGLEKETLHHLSPS